MWREDVKNEESDTTPQAFQKKLLKIKTKRKEKIRMKTSRNKLRKLIEKYADDELKDFLEYEVSNNDINGIVENVITDIDERISEYIETTSK